MNAEMKEMIELLKGTREDKLAVYHWLIAKVVAGEQLNYGYRQTLKSLHAELFN